MKNWIHILLIGSLLILFTQCKDGGITSRKKVADAKELNEAIANAEPGTTITMANGVWKDVQIKFVANGTEEKPITLRAETPGQVIIQGQSDLKLGGTYLNVDGLHFNNGASPSESVIQYFINDDTLAHHCKVTNCVIEDFNKAQKNKQDYWVLFRGRHNQLDHCYLSGKSNRGPTVRVVVKGNQSIKNYHQITNNYFGPRPPKGGPSAETIQIGDSSTSMSPSYTMVSNNLFDRCNGEVEVISSKTNFNEFRNNVFYKSEGSLVTRHGNYCIVDGNYFIGDELKPHVGGVRLIGTGHWVTNNYFYNLRGEIFRGPLAVMNGIRKSPLNRYIQVTDVVVAHNTYVNCESPWQLGVGSNIDQKDVLPASEIRDQVPIRTLIANNLIYNTKGDKLPIVRYDSIDRIDFKSNVINNQGVKFRGVDGLVTKDFSISELEENVWVPSTDFADVEVHNGFEFEQISKDLFGNDRNDRNAVGASNGAAASKPNLMDLSKYGPSWFDPSPKAMESKTHSAKDSKELNEALQNAKNGDVIILASSEYKINSSLKIDKKITIQSGDTNGKSTISYIGSAGTPAFEMNPNGELNLKSVTLKGSADNMAFASLKENMSSLYNLKVEGCDISNFDYLLKAYKHSFAENIDFIDCTFKNCNNGLELASEDDDKGEYNAENLTIKNCQFEGIQNNVINYYRGGYDESTVGGTLSVSDCTFTKSGKKQKNGILINTYGIIYVDIADNNFIDNPVKLIARLWGAKENFESNNTIKNSGKIITEQNLPLKLFY